MTVFTNAKTGLEHHFWNGLVKLLEYDDGSGGSRGRDVGYDHRVDEHGVNVCGLAFDVVRCVLYDDGSGAMFGGSCVD